METTAVPCRGTPHRWDYRTCKEPSTASRRSESLISRVEPCGLGSPVRFGSSGSAESAAAVLAVGLQKGGEGIAGPQARYNFSTKLFGPLDSVVECFRDRVAQRTSKNYDKLI